MDPAAGSVSKPALSSSRSRLQLLARRQHSLRDAAANSQKTTRDARLRRSPPKIGRHADKVALNLDGLEPGCGSGGGGAKDGGRRAAPKPKVRPFPGALSKPLLPATERRSHEDSGSPARRANVGSQEDDRWALTPDGGSAGREARQFAVANVGINGRIYLR